jgi:hypothetical protein
MFTSAPAVPGKDAGRPHRARRAGDKHAVITPGALENKNRIAGRPDGMFGGPDLLHQEED